MMLIAAVRLRRLAHSAVTMDVRGTIGEAMGAVVEGMRLSLCDWS